MKMKWQNRKRLAGRMVGLVTASVLAIGCIIAVPTLGGTAHAAPTLDLGEESKLQVTVEAKAMTEDGTPEMPDVVIDLYKVADAEKVDGYDAYTFKNLTGFDGLEFNIITDVNADHSKDYEEIWKPLAQQTAERIFNSFESASPITPVVESGAPNGSLAPAGASGLKPGLYLMVARGKDLSPEEYIVRDAEAQSVATVAYSDSYTFTSSPQLVALPTKSSNVNGEIASSNPGDWEYEYDLKMEPKFAVTERYGALAIDKVLESYVTGSPATFVFSVEATVRDEVVYSDVISMTFSGAGSQSVLLAADFEQVDTTGYGQLKTAKIPVGAKVVVTEVYSGQTYTPANGLTVHTVDSLSNAKPGEAEFAVNNGASFRNQYDGTGRKGSAITNHFEYKNDGAGLVWDLTQIPSVAPAPAPSPTPEVVE